MLSRIAVPTRAVRRGQGAVKERNGSEGNWCAGPLGAAGLSELRAVNFPRAPLVLGDE